jgi:hypothetical protein
MNADAIATLVLYAIQALQAGIAREAIIDDVRALANTGSTPDEISAYLKKLARRGRRSARSFWRCPTRLAELNAVKGPACVGSRPKRFPEDLILTVGSCPRRHR